MSIMHPLLYCDLLYTLAHCLWLNSLFFYFPQLHHCVNLLCILLGADDAAASSVGEEDSMWSGQIWSLQEHLRCSVLLPHPHCATGCGRRPALWVLMSGSRKSSWRPLLLSSISEFHKEFLCDCDRITVWMTMLNCVVWLVRLWLTVCMFQTTRFPTSYWSCLWSRWLFTCLPLKYR